MILLLFPFVLSAVSIDRSYPIIICLLLRKDCLPTLPALLVLS